MNWALKTCGSTSIASDVKNAVHGITNCSGNTCTDTRTNCCEACNDAWTAIPRALDCKEEGCRMVVKSAPLMIDHLCEECSAHFKALKKYLDALGIEYAGQSVCVRGLDYYTKTVFEIISNSIGAQGTVCGGGRYDKLMKQVGGPELPRNRFWYGN